MSYILDALRRADAERERERGAVPGLHSMPVGAAVPAAAARRPWAAAALAGVLLLLLLAGWWWWPAARMLPPETAEAPPAAPAPTPVPAAGPAVAPVPSPTQATPPPARPAPREARPRPALAAKAAPARPAAASAAPPDGNTAAPARTAVQAVPFEQLPDEVKRVLPPLAIGGVVYSDNPASRLLMVGGQVLKEGDSAGSGVTLEQIGPRSAVLRWKDFRYEIRY